MKKTIVIGLLALLVSAGVSAQTSQHWREMLQKVTTNVTMELGGVKIIGDISKPGTVLQYRPDGSLYCGGFGTDGNTLTEGMLVSGEGREIANCPGGWAYSGGFKGDRKEMFGTVYGRDGKVLYMGPFLNDQPTSVYPDTGSVILAMKTFDAEDLDDGSVYIGEYENGKRSGLGVYIWTSGNAWFGHWKESNREGTGFQMNYDGSYMAGTWKDGKYVNPQQQKKAEEEDDPIVKAKIKRRWEDVFNFEKRLHYDRGTYHIGDKEGGIVMRVWGRLPYKCNMYIGGYDYGFQGRGMLMVAEEYNIKGCKDSWVYVGHFDEGNMDGDAAKVYDHDGNLIYYGAFRKDRPEGVYPSRQSYPAYKFEIVNYRNGDKYIGETKNGKRNGMGLYVPENGAAWFGFWNDGSLNGQALLISEDGKYGMGMYRDGKRVK